MTDVEPEEEKPGFFSTVGHEVSDFLHAGDNPATPAPAASTDANVSDGTETSASSTDPIAPPLVSTDREDAPDVVPGKVLPVGMPSDTREVQAMKEAGTLPGLTDVELEALTELERAHDQIIAWLDYAKAQIAKVRRR